MRPIVDPAPRVRPATRQALDGAMPGPWSVDSCNTVNLGITASDPISGLPDGLVVGAVFRHTLPGIDTEKTALQIAASPAYALAWSLADPAIRRAIEDSLRRRGQAWAVDAIRAAEGGGR